MSYSIRVSDAALRQLASIPTRHRRRIIDRIEKLVDWPRHDQDVRPLEGEQRGLYRLRCGDYRVVLSIVPDRRVVVVEKVGPRGSVYT